MPSILLYELSFHVVLSFALFKFKVIHITDCLFRVVQLSSGPIAVSERNVREGSEDAVTMTLVPNVDGKRDTIPSG